MTTHFSTLGWEIPWTEEPGGLQSMGVTGVGYDLASKLLHMECGALHAWSYMKYNSLGFWGMGTGLADCDLLVFLFPLNV